MYCSECGKYYSSAAKSCRCDEAVSSVHGETASVTNAKSFGSAEIKQHFYLNELREKCAEILAPQRKKISKL